MALRPSISPQEVWAGDAERARRDNSSSTSDAGPSRRGIRHAEGGRGGSARLTLGSARHWFAPSGSTDERRCFGQKPAATLTSASARGETDPSSEGGAG